MLAKKETSAPQAEGTKPTRARAAKKAAAPTKEMKTTTLKNAKLNKVKLNWKEVGYTNCPLNTIKNDWGVI